MRETSTNDILKQAPVEQWCKAYFKDITKCVVADNNMAEAFNGWIMDARGMSIIKLFEEIRRLVMDRLSIKRLWASTWRLNISPMALEKLEQNMELSAKCTIHWSGDEDFEVIHGQNQHTLNIKTLTCSCNALALNGIPCCHGIACMYQEENNPEEYVSDWYSKEKYLASYGTMMHYVRGRTFYHKNCPPILPPVVKQQLGRPKKNRIKGKNEPKKLDNGTRNYSMRHCSGCKQIGHNIKSCTQRPNARQVT